MDSVAAKKHDGIKKAHGEITRPCAALGTEDYFRLMGIVIEAPRSHLSPVFFPSTFFAPKTE